MDKKIVLELLEEMIKFQKLKLMEVVDKIDPKLTSDDILNPQDFSKIKFDPEFNYEDGILTGILSVQTALRREFSSLEDKV